MRTRAIVTVAAVLAAGLLLGGLTVQVRAREQNAETPFTPTQLAERTLHRRAVEAVIWGMPAVNFDLLYQAFVQAGGKWNQVVYWSRPFGWRNQTLTPNPDTIYLHPFINTKEAGPVVLEIPPADEGSISGSVDDAWQTAIEDLGPAGVDKGKGGKYLILPPGYKGKVPDGHIPMPSSTYQSYAALPSGTLTFGPARLGRLGSVDLATAHGWQARHDCVLARPTSSLGSRRWPLLCRGSGNNHGLSRQW